MVNHYVKLPNSSEFKKMNANPTHPRDLGCARYIEGTRTYDNIRYGTHPTIYRLEFYDRCNVHHRIEITASEEFTLAFPVGTEIKWHGENGDMVRTGLDARTEVALVTFSHCDATMFGSPGVRVTVLGYNNEDSTMLEETTYLNVLNAVSQVGNTFKSFAEAGASIVTAAA